MGPHDALLYSDDKAIKITDNRERRSSTMERKSCQNSPWLRNVIRVDVVRWWTELKGTWRQRLASSAGSVPGERQQSSDTLTAQENTINSISLCVCMCVPWLYSSVYIREMSSLAITGLFFDGWLSMNTHKRTRNNAHTSITGTRCHWQRSQRPDFIATLGPLVTAFGIWSSLFSGWWLDNGSTVEFQVKITE